MASSTPLETLSPPIIDTTAIISLSAVLVIIGTSYALSLKLLSPSTPSSLRILFIWHAFDALIHFILEGSFLYNCLFTYITISPATHHPATFTNWLGHTDRLYGNFYGSEHNYMAKLWQVYARADKRWGGADPTVVSLEFLTVLVVGPMAVWVCALIARRDPMFNIWMIVLATSELYGGFMTFCPEWLTGNTNLDGSNFMFLWVYLVFFNMLWVFFPIYAIYVASMDIANAFDIRNGVIAASVCYQSAQKSTIYDADTQFKDDLPNSISDVNGVPRSSDSLRQLAITIHLGTTAAQLKRLLWRRSYALINHQSSSDSVRGYENNNLETQVLLATKLKMSRQDKHEECLALLEHVRKLHKILNLCRICDRDRNVMCFEACQTLLAHCLLTKQIEAFIHLLVASVTRQKTAMEHIAAAVHHIMLLESNESTTLKEVREMALKMLTNFEKEIGKLEVREVKEMALNILTSFEKEIAQDEVELRRLAGIDANTPSLSNDGDEVCMEMTESELSEALNGMPIYCNSDGSVDFGIMLGLDIQTLRQILGTEQAAAADAEEQSSRGRVN